jgi:hypothetical protein
MVVKKGAKRGKKAAKKGAKKGAKRGAKKGAKRAKKGAKRAKSTENAGDHSPAFSFPTRAPQHARSTARPSMRSQRAKLATLAVAAVCTILRRSAPHIREESRRCRRRTAVGNHNAHRFRGRLHILKELPTSRSSSDHRIHPAGLAPRGASI